MKKNIYDILDKELLGSFKLMDNISYNKCYYGYSDKFKKNIFIKIFNNNNIFKFNREKEIQIKYTNLYIYDFEILDNKILVLEYREYKNIKLLNNKTIISIANKIAEFHNKKIYYEINAINLVTKILNTLEKIKKRKDYKYLKNIVNNYEKFFNNVNHEEKLINKVNIHGDFSLRNIKLYNNKLEIIDFERSKKSIYFLDFIKFFYTDLNGNKNKINLFLEKYYKKSNQKNISEIFKHALILYTSLGIMKYTMDINDIEFEKIGLKMLRDVENFLKIEN